MPDRLQVKLRYQYIQNVNASLSADIQVMSGNSVHDPDDTNVGHQPTGYDQYSALYNTYYVSGSKISVEINNLRTDVPLQYTIYPDRLHASVGMLATVTPWENKGAKSIMVGTRDGGSGRRRISYYTTTRKQYQILRPSNYPGFQATTGTLGNDPSLQWYWNLITQTTDGSASLIYHATIKVTYYVTFYNQQTLENS